MQQLYRPHIIAILFWLTCYSWAVIEFWVGSKHKPHQRTKIGRQSDAFVVFAVILGVLVALAFKGALPNLNIYENNSPFYVSLVIIWSGVALRQSAIKTLGRYFVMTITTQSGQPVLTSGLYRLIRHPGYLGSLMSIVGVAIALNSLPGSALLIILPTIAFIHRIVVEESYLVKSLGEPYKNYTKHTKRLIPFVW